MYVSLQLVFSPFINFFFLILETSKEQFSFVFCVKESMSIPKFLLQYWLCLTNFDYLVLNRLTIDKSLFYIFCVLLTSITNKYLIVDLLSINLSVIFSRILEKI